ncbi:MAG TPA: glycosyltransferase family A protein, partial [Hyphomicrobium sp.]|nr:glycosyltransferase family A protein [Hyphomicrobium sp.]
MQPALSVIIPAHNEERFIRRCLESIAAARRFAGITVETIVVLNRCEDRTELIARSYGARCIGEDRRSLAAVRNTGVRASVADVVVTIDADSWMSPKAFTEVLHRMKSGRYIGGGCLIWPERWSVGIAFSCLAVLPYLIRP